jgi:hypothetical protein
MPEPFGKVEAEQRARRIVRDGRVRFTNHARERMEERSVGEQDVYNVVCGGWCEGHDPKGAGFTYRFVTQRLGVAVAFKDEDVLVVVTTWRI